MARFSFLTILQGPDTKAYPLWFPATMQLFLLPQDILFFFFFFCPCLRKLLVLCHFPRGKECESCHTNNSCYKLTPPLKLCVWIWIRYFLSLNLSGSPPTTHYMYNMYISLIHQSNPQGTVQGKPQGTEVIPQGTIKGNPSRNSQR